MKHRILALVLLVVMAAVGYFVYASQFISGSAFSGFPFRLGLDLNGGTALTYRADVSKVESGEVGSAMGALRDVIERRVNLFGVAEPIVQVEEAGTLGGNKENKLVVELPGVTDIGSAISMIGTTPLLEFKLLKGDGANLEDAKTAEEFNANFTDTGLTGRYVKRAAVEFNPTTGEPVVSLVFNSEGSDLFAEITKSNVNKVLAIFLDGAPISMPVIREEIRDGKAQISGNFNIAEAKTLVRNLNYGALPVPIELVGTQTVGASLGVGAIKSGVLAGLIGFALIGLFLILWYRVPGLLAVVALVMYIAISLAIFKLIPVTLTAAGIAGFILSIGMAVDANILIFERMKEEMKNGRTIEDAMKEGFHRAWLSIRDSNISSIITSVVLFWVGTSAVKGFALTLGIGVIISMFTAITVSRTFLLAVSSRKGGRLARFLMSNGIRS